MPARLSSSPFRLVSTSPQNCSSVATRVCHLDTPKSAHVSQLRIEPGFVSKGLSPSDACPNSRQRTCLRSELNRAHLRIGNEVLRSEDVYYDLEELLKLRTNQKSFGSLLTRTCRGHFHPVFVPYCETRQAKNTEWPVCTGMIVKYALEAPWRLKLLVAGKT